MRNVWIRHFVYFMHSPALELTGKNFKHFSMCSNCPLSMWHHPCVSDVSCQENKDVIWRWHLFKWNSVFHSVLALFLKWETSLIVPLMALAPSTYTMVSSYSVFLLPRAISWLTSMLNINKQIHVKSIKSTFDNFMLRQRFVPMHATTHSRPHSIRKLIFYISLHLSMHSKWR